MPTFFSHHAFDQVLARLHMSHGELQELLDANLCVPTGREGEKIHRLFYSKFDNYYFVAVQDERTDEVITVLPIDYENRWDIDGGALILAKKLIVGEQKTETESAPTPRLRERSYLSPTRTRRVKDHCMPIDDDQPNYFEKPSKPVSQKKTFISRGNPGESSPYIYVYVQVVVGRSRKIEYQGIGTISKRVLGIRVGDPINLETITSNKKFIELVDLRVSRFKKTFEHEEGNIPLFIRNGKRGENIPLRPI